jgi:Fibronectin type III domain
MGRRLVSLGVPLAMGGAAVAFGSIAALAGAGAAPPPIECTDARRKVEINATDGDAGLQVFLDGQAWNDVELLDPQGNAVLDVEVTGRAHDFGLTELFSESSEPPFEEFPLDQFMELFPEGTYTFEGTATDGTPMSGTAELTHDFPDGPEIVSPAAGSRVRRDQVVVAWNPVTTPAGIDIDGYQVLVVQEEPVLRVFSADLPSSATRLPVPAEFLQSHTEYKVEVLAVEAGGNQTLTELAFRTR